MYSSWVKEQRGISGQGLPIFERMEKMMYFNAGCSHVPQTTTIEYGNNTGVTRDVLILSQHCTNGISCTVEMFPEPLFICKRMIVYPDRLARINLDLLPSGYIFQSREPKVDTLYEYLPLPVLRPGETQQITAQTIHVNGKFIGAPY